MNAFCLPTIEVTPSVHVLIRYSKGDTISLDFQEWFIAAKILPIRGTAASSPPMRLSRVSDRWAVGQWVGAFEAADWPAVKAWLDQRTTDPDEQEVQ